MKKFLVSAVLAAGMALTAAAPAFAETTLRLSLQVAVNHPVGKNIVLFKQELEKISKGAMKVEIYDSAQLYKGSEIPQAVGSGAIDMGMVLIDEFAGTLPVTGLFSVAFMFPNYDVLAKAANPDSPIRKTLDETIRKTGARVLWWQDYGPIQLLSKGAPTINPADMKGKKVRVLGKPSGDFIKALGGIPVKIGGSEQFLAYQRGTVDIGMTGTTAIKSRKLFEVMDSVTITNHAQTEFLIVVNDKKWNSLTDQERGWMTTAARTAENTLRAATKDNNISAEKWIGANTKMKVINLNKEQIAAWQAAAKPATEAYIAAAGEEGRKLVDAVRKLY